MARSRSLNPGKWLLICFPYGLYLMWGRRCRWHMAVKCAVTALIAVLIVGIALIPSPTRSTATKINIVGKEPNANVFGPEMPEGYDLSSYIVPEGGEDLIAEVEDDDTVYVYASATEGSTYYHMPNCKYAFATAKRMTVYEGYIMGYTTPCGICNPPIYDPGTGEVVENPGATPIPGAR